MKKNNILYLLLFLAAGAFTGCIEEETDVIDGTAVGAYPEVTEIVNGFYNLLDLDNASAGFSVASYGTDVTSITVMKSIKDSGKVEHETISGSSGAVMIPLDAALQGTGVSKGDLALGDVFTYTFKLNTADGRTLEPAESVTIPMSCVSDIGGSYTAVSNGSSTDGCCPDPVNVTTTVTLTAKDGGVYEISDWSGGLYFDWYDVYGMTADGSAGEIRDVCNNISFITASEPYGESLSGSGSVDPATGVITISWSNGWGDQGTSTLTPQ